MRAVLLAILCLVAAPAAAEGLSDGFGPGDVRRFSDEVTAGLSAQERARLAALSETAFALRAGLAGAPDRFRARLTAAEQGILDRLIAPGDALDRARWSYFFRGSVVSIGHTFGPRPRIGFYNPLADGWAMADLAPVGSGGFALAAFEAGTAGGNADTRPPWTLAAGVALPSALAERTAAAIDAFEAAHPPLDDGAPAGSPAGDAAALEARLDLLGGTVASFLADPPYRALAERILAGMAAGDAAALRGLAPDADPGAIAPLERISVLGGAVRRDFRLVGTFRHGGGMLAAFGTPHSGRWLLFADLDTSGPAPAVTHLLLIDLGQVP